MNIVHRLAERAKKFIWIIIAVPLIFGAAGWLVPIGKTVSPYTATATIALGSYSNPDFNDPNHVMTLLGNSAFFQKQLPDLWKTRQSEILSQLKVSAVKNELIQISFTGKSKNDAVDTVNRIADSFLSADRQQYQKRETLINQSISALKTVKINENTAVDRQRFLYDLQTAKLNIKPAQLLEPADAAAGPGGRAFSSKQRAVLGVMLGLTIVFLWIVFPELVRERRE
ncbi:hydrolase [Sporolactobacillus sp. CQH2019]|uniref:hydrolase n=1 Tax=Sporolactobacillus sp. CQH2019 TaxID=3023512 RepID=UPI002368E87A|nr:hydrolase [Sporolactobacillus sp. CQH2019]MDD9149044.1 hydrolase [Sporolactobacillus sp. CQH2019]